MGPHLRGAAVSDGWQLKSGDLVRVLELVIDGENEWHVFAQGILLDLMHIEKYDPQMNQVATILTNEGRVRSFACDSCGPVALGAMWLEAVDDT